MDAAIHAFSGSKSEAAQAEPNTATTAAIAEAPAKRDRFDNLRQDPDDMVVLKFARGLAGVQDPHLQ
jgi:hypothetical protein